MTGACVRWGHGRRRPACEHRRRPVPRKSHRPRRQPERAGRRARHALRPSQPGAARLPDGRMGRGRPDPGGRPLARDRVRRGVRCARLRPPPRPLVPGAPPEPWRARGAVAGDAPARPGRRGPARARLRAPGRAGRRGRIRARAGRRRRLRGRPWARRPSSSARSSRCRVPSPKRRPEAASGCSPACSTRSSRGATFPTACASGPSARAPAGSARSASASTSSSAPARTRLRQPGADPPGLSGIFDDDELDAMERAAARVPGRWRRIAAGVAGAGRRWRRPGWRSSTRGRPPSGPSRRPRAADDAPTARGSRRPQPRARTWYHASAPPSREATAARSTGAPDTGSRRRRRRRRILGTARVDGPGRARTVHGRPDGPARAGRHDAPRPLSRPAATIAACGPRPTTSFASTRPPAPRPGMPTRRTRRSRWVPRSSRPAAGSRCSASTSRTPRTGSRRAPSETPSSRRSRAGLRDFAAIAVHAEAGSAPPCGACRQVLAEFSPSMTVVYRSGGDVVATTVAELLPDRFEP